VCDIKRNLLNVSFGVAAYDIDFDSNPQGCHDVEIQLGGFSRLSLIRPLMDFLINGARRGTSTVACSSAWYAGNPAYSEGNRHEKNAITLTSRTAGGASWPAFAPRAYKWRFRVSRKFRALGRRGESATSTAFSLQALSDSSPAAVFVGAVTSVLPAAQFRSSSDTAVAAVSPSSGRWRVL
ncbi:hypothetical protein MTO96_027680, partial [Rhipicephalus appendiculatus]